MKYKNKKVSKDGKSGKVESLVIFRCNCRCIMCSTGLQIDRSQSSCDYHAIRPYEEVKKDIEKARDRNAFGFAFSGGEPTLRKDLPGLVRYARDLGLEHIEVQSNGRIYANEYYCQKLIDAGVNNFVVSLHSRISETNDKIMGVPGSFAQTVAGIKNLNKLGQVVKINIVLMKLNYEDLVEHVKFLLGNFKIKEFRFTFVMLEGNVLDDPRGIVAPMSKVAPKICEAIDLAKTQVECFIYNMVPCLLSGYEQYINDMGDFDTLLLGPEFETSLDDSRKTKKIKSAECKRCNYNNVCDGVWKNYANEFGVEELKPNNNKYIPVLKKINLDYQSFFLLKAGLKPVIRIEIERRYKKRFVDFCKNNDIFYFIAKADFLFGKTSNRSMAYLSLKPALSERTYEAEKANDVLDFGRMLGYPKCCIEKFNPSLNVRKDYIISALKNTKNKLSFYCNNVYNFESKIPAKEEKDKLANNKNFIVELERLFLIKHMPCSFDCQESIKQGKKTQAIIKEENPELAQETEEILKKPILYFNHFKWLTFDGTVKGDELKYNNILTSISLFPEEIIKTIKKGNRVKVSDKQINFYKDKQLLLKISKQNEYDGILLNFQ